MKIVAFILMLITLFSFIFALTKCKEKRIAKIIFIAVGVISLVISFVINMSNYINPQYYDRIGNKYDSVYDVVYYTNDDCEFIYNGNSFTCIKNNNKYKSNYDYKYVYIDEQGYLYFTDAVLDYLPNSLCCYDKITGKLYIDAHFARWDKQGNLYHLGEPHKSLSEIMDEYRT